MRKLTHDHSPVGEREDAQEIGEIDAMRHPRRHEVFRDVGGALRDKDEADYVEMIEDDARAGHRDPALHRRPDRHGARRRRSSASCGGTPAAPEAVVEALVAAANEAGGRDNVTVVYAEGPGLRARSPWPTRRTEHPPLRRASRTMGSTRELDRATRRRESGRLVLSLDRAQQDDMVRAWRDRRRAAARFCSSGGRRTPEIGGATHHRRRRSSASFSSSLAGSGRQRRRARATSCGSSQARTRSG